MKIKLTLAILVLPLMMEVLIGCDNGYDSPVREIEVSHCSLELSELDNSGAAPQLNYDDSITREAFAIRARIIRQEYSCRIEEGSNFHFISSAMAIYPYQDYDYQFVPLEEITSIRVQSVNQFGPDLPAGSDITDLFRVRSSQEFRYFTVEEYRSRMAIETFGYENRNLEFDMFLMEATDSHEEQQFKVIIELSDGRTLEATTEPIYLV
ncbi:DUF5034 domain-containing protein [Halocola ammonii]